MRSSIRVALLGFALVPALAGAQVDLSRYVALGDSLTAGFESGGLAASSQARSYPLVIHKQATGSDAFAQPTVSDPGIPAQLRLINLAPTIAPKPGQGQPTNLNLPRPYDNLGVPGARVSDTLNRVTDNGGLHDLILRGQGTALQQALALQPTFVTLWIGNNDVLAAATSGIVVEGVTLTPVAQFESDFRAIAGALAASGAKLAFATIPRVTTIPFVTTVPPIVVNPATREPVIVNGQTVPLIGPDGPLSFADRVLLTAQTELGQGKGIPTFLGGTGQPLSNSVVLSAAEVAAITARAEAYNAIIRSVANSSGAALVDVERIFDRIAANGYTVGGVDLSVDFLTGGLFSYDGVHATGMGYAIIADEFIKAINDKFGSSIQRANLGKALKQGAATTAAVSALEARMATFTDHAEENLRWVMGLPSKERLEAMAPGGGKKKGNGKPNHPEELPEP